MFNEISLMAWISGAIVFIIGGGVGFYIARQIKDKHTLGLENQLETTQNQLSEYRGEVNRHFLKTSLLFNKLTDDYRDVYEHLATGAQKLCNDKPLSATLDLPEAKILAAAPLANAEKPEEVDAITPMPTDSKHDDTAQPADIETTTAETAPAEGTDLPKKIVEESTKVEQTLAEPSIIEPSATEKSAPAADTPTITKEELKALEANERKDEDDDIHLGAESTSSVKPEHHKTHPSIH